MSHNGFEYEKETTSSLKKIGLVPFYFFPAGATHSSPDLVLEHNNRLSGCELKISPSSAGSLVLKHDELGWKFNGIPIHEKNKRLLRDISHEIKLLDILDTNWDVKKISSSYQECKQNFTEVKGRLDPRIIEQYYINKDTHYINIGTRGLYMLGTENPLNIENVPIFSDYAEAKWRARVQYKGSERFQFTFEFSFNIHARNRSQFNLAPIENKIIRTDRANLACFK